MLSVTDWNDINYYNRLAYREYKRMCELLADPATEHNVLKVGEILDATTRCIFYLNLINYVVLGER